MNPVARELGATARRRQLLTLLLTQVLGLSGEDVAAAVAALEPVLSPEATDRICTFLGHPTVGADERPIPPGDCCRTLAGPQGEIVEPVAPLTQMRVGDDCEVVLIRPRNHARLHRLTTYGIVPGSLVRLHQKRPAFVIQVGETDLALDGEVAADILVRRKNAFSIPPVEL